MWALDIETLGTLDQTPLPALTCVCLWNGTQEHSIRFYGLGTEECNANRDLLLHLLDSAHAIAGFNAVLFDLEFIRRTFAVSQERMQAWVLKCWDPFMLSKFILKRTCSLHDLLLLNGLPDKTGKGSDAIQLALQGQWASLLEYCMTDAKLTFQLCTLPRLQFSPGLCWDTGRGTFIFVTNK
jgi:hypothetical protein